MNSLRAASLSVAWTALLATGALAAPPDACSLISLSEVNTMAKKGDAVSAEKRGTGAESQCHFLDAGKSSVLTVEVRETADAAADLKMDAAVLERLYKRPLKPIPGVGDEALWCDHQNSVTFRKGKLAGRVYFTGSKYGGEPVTVAIAKLVTGRIR
jgi:hypothetical protein